MTLLEKILTWSTQGLLPWQRDALRRLLQKRSLDPQDYEDLYAMLKSSHGIPDSKSRTADPLDKKHLPVKSSGAAPIVLLSMRNLKHVNRIPTGQKLDFAAAGITVIYGPNAAGKSGYSRVLKRACRARDTSETVHTDVFDPAQASSTPEATFDIAVAGANSSVVWKRGLTPPDELASIAVFDSKCARSYLDEGDVAYLPYGLDIVESLGQRVLPEILQRLTAEIAALSTDASPFADLLGETKVGKLIAALGPDTDPTVVTALATLSDSEKSRLAALDKALLENDPKARATGFRLFVKRIDALKARINAAVKHVDDVAIERCKSIDKAADAATKAEKAAAEQLRSDAQLLPGTGEAAWKLLFEAARRFSTEAAYPSRLFPYVEVGAQCVLCQQSIASDAAERLRRFDDFVKQDIATTSRQKQDELRIATQALGSVSVGFGMDGAIREELRAAKEGLVESLLQFEAEIEARKAWLIEAMRTHSWGEPIAFTADCRALLEALESETKGKAAELESAADEVGRKALEVERAELKSRVALSVRLKSLLDLVTRMKTKALLNNCRDDLKSRGISEKAKEFASEAVTAALKKALDAEFAALGVGHIKPKLIERVEKSKMKHKLVLDIAGTRDLEEILSEGEQRVIGIGSFLAELHLAGHLGGIVFDDPVSSLDHYWRKNVAKRLVQEAKKRQVVVLTHDTVFLGELLDCIEHEKVNNVMHHLEWSGGKPGHVSPGLPWEHLPYGERIDRLEKDQKNFETSWPAYPNEEERGKMRREYSHLRAAIERVIEEVVFSGAVKRYRDWVKVGELRNVVGFTKPEFEEISRLHQACCDVVDAHDPSPGKPAHVPDAKQLGKDIADLRKVVEAIKARRKASASGP